ncbi:MAG: hypothetical protein K5829_01120 [Treponema sp.]|nr:hypothetical protein [Treponema sp.]
MKGETFNKILLGMAILIIAIIVAGTIIGFATKKAVPGKNLRDADPAPTERQIESLNKKSTEKIDAYNGLGTLRAVTLSDPAIPNDAGTPVVITPWFSYPDGDTVFFEELSRKRLLLSGIITNYFSLHTKNQLLTLTEESIKSELLEELNNQLSLGKIVQIYFTDYIFLE